MLLRCRALTIGFQRPLIGPLNFSVRVGERLLITGPNGSGKSLLLRALTGNARIFSGQLVTESATLAYLSQEHPRPSPWPLSGHDWFAAMRTQAPTVPAIQALLTQRLDRLSGGQWQLLRLAAVLSSAQDSTGNPLILLDEPSNHLDAQVRATAVQLIRELPRECTLLLTSHDQEFIREIGWSPTPMEQLLEHA